MAMAIASIILPGAIAYLKAVLHNVTLPTILPIKTKPNLLTFYVPAPSTTYNLQSCIYQQPSLYIL